MKTELATTGTHCLQRKKKRIIQKRGSDAGVEDFIAGHSLRVGSAVALA